MSERIRRIVRETLLHPSNFILPLFVTDEAANAKKAQFANDVLEARKAADLEILKSKDETAKYLADSKNKAGGEVDSIDVHSYSRVQEAEAVDGKVQLILDNGGRVGFDEISGVRGG